MNIVFELLSENSFQNFTSHDCYRNVWEETLESGTFASHEK